MACARRIAAAPCGHSTAWPGASPPSAEVKGHGPGQEVLVLGKENVGIVGVEPVGQYAVKPRIPPR